MRGDEWLALATIGLLYLSLLVIVPLVTVWAVVCRMADHQMQMVRELLDEENQTEKWWTK